MDISGLSDNRILALAQMLNTSKLQEQVQTSVLKLANQQIKQDGKNAIQLIQATPYGSLGNNIDIRA